MNAARWARPDIMPIDESPPHELAVERFAAKWVGALGPQTLLVIMLRAQRAAERYDRSGDGVAVALAHLNDVGNATTPELARLMGKSLSWADELIAAGRRIEGDPPRRPGRRRAAG